MTEKKSPKSELVVAGNNEVTKRVDTSSEALLAQAVQSGASVEVLEKLLSLKERVDASRAKAEFHQAMSKFQSECPVIKKKKTVKDKVGKDRYSYAPLGDIVTQVKDILTRNGLSYKFNEEKDEKFATAICIITHVAGHSESSAFKVEIGNEEYMTSVQKYGARMTFAKRYAFCDALGILTADEDNDANTGKADTEKPAKPPAQKASQEDLFKVATTMIGKLTKKSDIKLAITNIEASNGVYTEEQKNKLLNQLNEKYLASN